MKYLTFHSNARHYNWRISNVHFILGNTGHVWRRLTVIKKFFYSFIIVGKSLCLLHPKDCPVVFEEKSDTSNKLCQLPQIRLEVFNVQFVNAL